MKNLESNKSLLKFKFASSALVAITAMFAIKAVSADMDYESEFGTELEPMTVLAQDDLSANAVRTVPSVDLKQYLGKWYEIATIPQSFQKDCVSDVTADYAVAEKNRIQVLNSCQTKSGNRKVGEGRAKVVNSKSNAELKVTFAKLGGWIFLFGGDYWVIGLGDKYDYAVVGHPSRKYAWILSRTPALSPVQLTQAAKSLTDNGYDLCQLKTTLQKGGLNQKIDFCDLVK